MEMRSLSSTVVVLFCIAFTDIRTADEYSSAVEKNVQRKDNSFCISKSLEVVYIFSYGSKLGFVDGWLVVRDIQIIGNH